MNSEPELLMNRFQRAGIATGRRDKLITLRDNDSDVDWERPAQSIQISVLGKAMAITIGLKRWMVRSATTSQKLIAEAEVVWLLYDVTLGRTAPCALVP